MAVRYLPKVYRKQGSTELVVANGGMVRVQSGGEINVESGGAVKAGSTAVISGDGLVSPVGGLAMPIETGTSLANLANHGVSKLNPTTSAVYTLSAPVAGVVKIVEKIQATTTLTATIYAGPTTTVTFDGSNTKLLVSQPQSIMLVGDSTLRWRFCPSSQYFGFTSDVVASSS